MSSPASLTTIGFGAFGAGMQKIAAMEAEVLTYNSAEMQTHLSIANLREGQPKLNRVTLSTEKLAIDEVVPT